MQGKRFFARKTFFMQGKRFFVQGKRFLFKENVCCARKPFFGVQCTCTVEFEIREIIVHLNISKLQ